MNSNKPNNKDNVTFLVDKRRPKEREKETKRKRDGEKERERENGRK